MGIEKFLSTSFIEHVSDNLGLRLTTPVRAGASGWRYDVDRKSLADLKTEIHSELARRQDSTDIRALIDALPWLSGHLAALPPLL